MRTLRQEDCDLILGALDTLGCSLADYDHVWTEGEKEIYEQACQLLGLPPCKFEETDERLE